MAWIESHQRLEKSHKLFDLQIAMNWPKCEAIGRLHVFWWWCVDHAEDGDLRKFNDGHLALAVGLDMSAGKAFVEAMLHAGFMERSPYFRVKNWWEYFGNFLKKRYSKNPEKWKAIRDKYLISTEAVIPENTTKPNLTEPNQKQNPPASPAAFSQKSPHSVDLSKIRVFRLGEPAKHKIYNATVKVFSVRGWDLQDLPLYAFENVAKSMADSNPRDPYPYFMAAMERYCNENAEYFSAQSKIKKSKNGNGVHSVGMVLQGMANGRGLT